MTLAKVAFGFNIFILVPVCWNMFFSDAVTTVFDGKVDPSDGLRLMVGSLWFAILVCSAIGLFRPEFFLPILAVQVIYKAMWLATFAYPLWLSQGIAAVPMGIVSVFVLIVASYPFVLWNAIR